MKPNLKFLETTLSNQMNERLSSILSLEIKDMDFFVSDLKNEPIRLEEKKAGKRKSKKIKSVNYIKCESSDEDTLSSLFERQEKEERKDGYSSLCIAFPFLKKDSMEEPLLLLPIKLTKLQSDYYIEAKWDYSIQPNRSPFLASLNVPDYDTGKSLAEYLSALNYLFKNNTEVHLEFKTTILECDLNSRILMDYLSRKSQEEKNDSILRFDSVEKKTVMGQNKVFHIRDCGKQEVNCVRKEENGQSFSISYAPGYQKEDVELNLVSDALVHGKKVLVVSWSFDELSKFKEAWKTTKTMDATLSMFDMENSSKELSVSKSCFDKKYLNPPEANDVDDSSKKRLDDYAKSFYERDEDFSKSASELYPALLELEDVPLMDDCTFDVRDFSKNKYEYALNNIRFIQKDLDIFTRNYSSHVYFGLRIQDKKTMQAFQKSLLNSRKSLDTIEAVLSSLFPERKLSEFSLSQVKDIFDFLKKFYALSIVEPLFFQSTKRKSLVNKLNEVLPMIAIEENLVRNISRIARLDILSMKNLQHIKDHFDSKYHKVLSMFSKGYRKDMQLLNQYALSPLSKENAFELVRLLENYQVNHKKISLFLTKFRKQLSESTILTEENCSRFVEENLFYENIKGDIDYLKDKTLNEVLQFKKDLPIRNINSVDFSYDLQSFYDKSIVDFSAMNLEQYSRFVTKSIQEIELLPEFLAFIRRLELAKTGKYSSFLDSYLKKNPTGISLEECFKKKFFSSLLDYFYEKYPVLKEMTEREYEKCISDFEKKYGDEEKFNLTFLKSQLNHMRFIEMENFSPMEAKRIFRKNGDVLSYLNDYSTLLKIVFPLQIMTLSQAIRLLPEDMEYDLVLLLDSQNTPVLATLPLLLRSKQTILLKEMSLTLPDASSIHTIASENEIRLTHSQIDEGILSFANRQFFDSSLISYPYFNINPIRLKSFTYSTKTDPKLIEHEILLEIESEKREKPDSRLTILALTQKQKNILKTETKEPVYSLDEFQGQEEQVIIPLYEAFENTDDNPFYKEDGKNSLMKIFTSARIKLTILYFKKIDAQTNKMGLPPCLKLLKEYLYSSTRNIPVARNDEKSEYGRIRTFLQEKEYDILPNAGYKNDFDFILLKNGVPFAVLDFYDSKTESISSAFDRDLRRRKVMEERGIQYLRILPSCFSNDRKSSQNWLSVSLKRLEKNTAKKTTD